MGLRALCLKDTIAVMMPRTAPMANDPMKIPKKSPMDLKKLPAVNAVSENASTVLKKMK